MQHARRLPGAALAATVAGAFLCSAPGTASELDYVPIEGVSAEPTAPLWKSVPTMAESCDRRAGQRAGLLPRPAFPPGLGTAEDLAAFIDAEMCKQFDDAYIAGAAVAIVDGGRIAFSSGYGHADLANQVRVDPVRTLFRIGSISKVLTWTALMQLVDKGLSLTADISGLLPASVRIPATFPDAVTPRNLMTHTTGFEVNITGIGLAPHGQPAPALEQTIAQHVPARVRAPATAFTRGSDAAYSNWVGALGGYLVEHRAQEPFADHLDRHVFGPLDMRHSSFREPLPPSLRALASAGYRSDDGYPPCIEPSAHGLAPASSASASAEDMAKFMMAHLDEGGRLLLPATARLMHARAFSPHRHLAGATYGFNERYMNGRRLLWHAGATPCAYAEFYLFPEERIGLFVAYNTHPLASQRAGLVKAFMDRYFPATLPELGPSPGDAAALAPLAGYYRSTSRAQATWEKAFDLTSAIRIDVTDDGLLLAPVSPGSRILSGWVRLKQAPDVLRRVDADDTMAIAHENGETYLLGPWPFAPMVKLEGLSHPEANRVLVGLCSLAFFLAILVFLRRTADPYWPQHRAATMAAAIGVVNLAILACLALTIRRSTVELMIAVPWTISVASWLAVGSLVLCFGLALLIARGWRSAEWTLGARTGFTALALTEFAFAGWLWHWNLVGPHLG